MDRKSRNMLVFIVLLTAAVVVMLVLAIPSWGPLHRDEFGLMTYCDTEAGPRYVDLGTGQRIERKCLSEIKTARLKGGPPFPVYAYSNNPDFPGDPKQMTRSAIGWMNSKPGAGFPLLRWEDDPLKAQVVVALGTAQLVDPAFKHVHGSTRLQPGMGVAITVSNLPDVATAFTALRHELGHAVGLGHDDFESSFMYPALQEGGLSYRMTDDDRKLLAYTYSIGNE